MIDHERARASMCIIEVKLIYHLPVGWTPSSSNTTSLGSFLLAGTPQVPSFLLDGTTRGSNSTMLNSDSVLPAGWHPRRSDQEKCWFNWSVNMLRFVFHKEFNGTRSRQDNLMCLSYMVDQTMNSFWTPNANLFKLFRNPETILFLTTPHFSYKFL